jgi:D-glycero-beta-D-manno-heptose 1-phosphate adenylyltransferase
MTDTTLLPPAFLSKLASRHDAVQRVAALRAQGPVVFTNGVFDVLHRGHASYLAQARSLGGSLVVACGVDGGFRVRELGDVV